LFDGGSHGRRRTQGWLTSAVNAIFQSARASGLYVKYTMAIAA
jgi:hypothetical protein